MQPSDLRIGFCTAPERESAERIAHALVEEHLAACVNIVPNLVSVYRWEGKVVSSEEILLIIKTSARVPVSRIRDRLLTLHPYDVPELLLVPVAEGLEKYLAWMEASVEPEP
jgi:periplasmic divalent cation tolerance protein